MEDEAQCEKRRQERRGFLGLLGGAVACGATAAVYASGDERGACRRPEGGA